jgi:hypothetical protein
VRQALEAAIDRKVLSDVVSNGENLPGNQWVSPKSPYYQEKYPVRGRDVAKAKKLLADAGGGGLHDPEPPGEPTGGRSAAGHGGRGGLRSQDPRHRVRHLHKRGGARPLSGVLRRLERAHRPDGNSYAFLKCGAPLNQAYHPSVGVLKNPYNDLAVVGQALSRQGFEVLSPIRDAKRTAILGGVRDRARRLNAAGAGG